ncbi:hypothetical protein SAMN04487898_102258 [Pedobacter sp. ok626]|nr:hypothetical protein SAMN04487898_102258 [Pedobacter sp. ok626]
MLRGAELTVPLYFKINHQLYLISKSLPSFSSLTGNQLAKVISILTTLLTSSGHAHPFSILLNYAYKEKAAFTLSTKSSFSHVNSSTVTVFSSPFGVLKVLVTLSGLRPICP